MRFHSRWAVAALSVIASCATSFEAPAAGLTWLPAPDQTSIEVGVSALIANGVDNCPYGSIHQVFGFSSNVLQPSNVTIGLPCPAPPGVTASASFGLSFDNTGLSASAAASGTNNNNLQGDRPEAGTQLVAFFAVTDPGGVDLSLNLIWQNSTSWFQPNALVVDILFDNGAILQSMLQGGLNPNNVTGASAGNETRYLHLGPETYMLQYLQTTNLRPGIASSADITSSLSLQVVPVPVPGAAWLFGSGLLGLIGVARRKARSA